MKEVCAGAGTVHRAVCVACAVRVVMPVWMMYAATTTTTSSSGGGGGGSAECTKDCGVVETAYGALGGDRGTCGRETGGGIGGGVSSSGGHTCAVLHQCQVQIVQ
jgi:hypothetical protein